MQISWSPGEMAPSVSHLFVSDPRRFVFRASLGTEFRVVAEVGGLLIGASK